MRTLKPANSIHTICLIATIGVLLISCTSATAPFPERPENPQLSKKIEPKDSQQSKTAEKKRLHIDEKLIKNLAPELLIESKEIRNLTQSRRADIYLPQAGSGISIHIIEDQMIDDFPAIKSLRDRYSIFVTTSRSGGGYSLCISFTHYPNQGESGPQNILVDEHTDHSPCKNLGPSVWFCD